MEMLLKEKKFKDALDFYETEKDKKNWNIFLLYLAKDKKLKEFFIDYILKKNDLLSLYWFFSNLFESSKDNIKENNEVLLEITNRLYLSDTIYKGNSNLLSISFFILLKLYLIDSNIQKRMEDFLLLNSFDEEASSIMMTTLEKLDFYYEQGIMYEKRQNYLKALELYKKSNNKIKIEQMNETIVMINSESLLDHYKYGLI